MYRELISHLSPMGRKKLIGAWHAQVPMTRRSSQYSSYHCVRTTEQYAHDTPNMRCACGRDILRYLTGEVLFTICSRGFYTCTTPSHVTISLPGQCVRKVAYFSLLGQNLFFSFNESCNLANLGPCSFNHNLHVLDAVFRESIPTSLPRSPRFVFFHVGCDPSGRDRSDDLPYVRIPVCLDMLYIPDCKNGPP